MKILKNISSTNPHKFYVEDIKKVYFFIPKFICRLMCEMAVVDGLFTKSLDDNSNTFYSLASKY